METYKLLDKDMIAKLVLVSFLLLSTSLYSEEPLEVVTEKKEDKKE